MSCCERSFKLGVVILCLCASIHASGAHLGHTFVKATTAVIAVAAAQSMKEDQQMGKTSGVEHGGTLKSETHGILQSEAKAGSSLEDVKARLDWLCDTMHGRGINSTGQQITLSQQGIAHLSLRSQHPDISSTVDWNVSCYSQAVQPARIFTILAAPRKLPVMQCRANASSGPCPCRLIRPMAQKPNEEAKAPPPGVGVGQDHQQCTEADQPGFLWVAMQWLSIIGPVYTVWQWARPCTCPKRGAKNRRQRRSTAAEPQSWSMAQLFWTVVPRKWFFRHLQVALPVAVFGTGLVIAWLVLKAGAMLAWEVVTSVSFQSLSKIVKYLLPLPPIVTLFRFLTGCKPVIWPDLSCLFTEEELQILRGNGPASDTSKPLASADLAPDRSRRSLNSKDNIRVSETEKTSLSCSPKRGVSARSVDSSPSNINDTGGIPERKMPKCKDAATPPSRPSAEGARQATKVAKVSSLNTSTSGTAAKATALDASGRKGGILSSSDSGTAAKPAAVETPVTKGKGGKDAGNSSVRKNRTAARRGTEGRARVTEMSAPASTSSPLSGSADDAATTSPDVLPALTPPETGHLQQYEPAPDDCQLGDASVTSSQEPVQNEPVPDDSQLGAATAKLNQVALPETNADRNAAGSAGAPALKIIEKGKGLEDNFAKSVGDPIADLPADADDKNVTGTLMPAAEPESEPSAEPAVPEPQSNEPKQVQDEELWLEQRGQRRRRRPGQGLPAKTLSTEKEAGEEVAPSTEKDAGTEIVHMKQPQEVLTDKPVVVQRARAVIVPPPPSGPAPAPPAQIVSAAATHACVDRSEPEAAVSIQETPAPEMKPGEERRMAAEHRLVERIASSVSQRKAAEAAKPDVINPALWLERSGSSMDHLPHVDGSDGQDTLPPSTKEAQLLGQWIASTCWSCPNVSNVLDILSGERIQVVDAQGGWAYGYKIALAEKLGWFPRFLLKHEALTSEPRQLSGQVVRLIRDYQESDHPSGGYLSASCGDEVQIKYQDEDLHWCYGFASDGTMGWLPEAICQPSS